MHDQSCQLPSAACQIEKSTGCWFGPVSVPRSGSPAICQNSPSMDGMKTGELPPPPVPLVAADEESDPPVPLETEEAALPACTAEPPAPDEAPESLEEPELEEANAP